MSSLVSQFLHAMPLPILTSVRVVCRGKLDDESLWAIINDFYDATVEWSMDDAAREGFLSLVQRLDAIGTSATVDAIDWAASHGHLNVVQWLTNHRCDGATAHAMDGAAGSGYLHVVQWLHKHRKEGCTTSAMDLACGNGHMHIVQWLHEHRIEGASNAAMEMAAGSGDLRLLQWLHERHYNCTTNAMDVAAANGHLIVLKWLHEHRVEGCTTFAMNMAVRHNHLNVVNWLHRHHPEAFINTQQAMQDAIRMKHLDMIKFLCTHGYGDQSRPVSLAWAATSNQLDVLEELLQWCSYSMVQLVTAMEAAAKVGSLAMLLRLQEHMQEKELVMGSCPYQATTVLMDTAAAHGHLSIVQHLHSAGHPCSVVALDQASAGGHKEVVDFLLTFRGEVGGTVAAIDRSAANGHKYIVERLIQCQLRCSGFALLGASAHGYHDIVSLLLVSFPEFKVDVHGDGKFTWPWEEASRLAAANGYPNIVATLKSHNDHNVNQDY